MDAIQLHNHMTQVVWITITFYFINLFKKMPKNDSVLNF